MTLYQLNYQRIIYCFKHDSETKGTKSYHHISIWTNFVNNYRRTQISCGTASVALLFPSWQFDIVVLTANSYLPFASADERFRELKIHHKFSPRQVISQATRNRDICARYVHQNFYIINYLLLGTWIVTEQRFRLSKSGLV